MNKSTKLRKTPQKNNKIKNFIINNKYILLIMVLLFLERVYGMYHLGITYNLGSDDLSYFISGITFKNTGSITMHGYLSAQIVPGMPVLIGFMSIIFGEGKLLWLVLKLLWFFMNSCSAFYLYKIVTIYTPKWCGFIATLPLFWADFIWMDNIILTETPFLLLFIAMIYYTIMMGRSGKRHYFYLCLTCYMLALMFKANVGIYPLFAFVYLLIVKYDFLTLLKQCLILACVLLCFIVPWSIRNYVHYDAFVPLTWGAGNPLLLGTYQGHGYPLDDTLDYKTNVEDVIKEKFSKYYNDHGTIVPKYMENYISLEKDEIMAKYRMKQWAKNDPLSMFDSYFIQKPRDMIHSVFYWREIFNIPVTKIIFWRDINWILSIITLLASIYFKKYRSIMFFLSSLYIGNIYIYAMTYSFDRYAATLLPLRYIILGIGVMPLMDLVKLLHKKLMDYKV